MLGDKNRQGKGVEFPAKKHLLFPVRTVDQNLYAIAVNDQGCLRSLKSGVVIFT